ADGGAGGIRRDCPAPSLGVRMPGAGPRRGSDGAGALPNGKIPGPGPGGPAGVPNRRGGAGYAGAGRVRRAGRQVLLRRLCNGGPGGDFGLRPPREQAEAHPGGGGATGPCVHP
ncbi:Major facilitator superfamily (MFS) profile domain-containing protein, partial [Dysosmobacter welbionis]